MKKTSILYNELFDSYLNDNSNVYFETRLSIDGNAYLINEEGFNITFGGYRIIVDDGLNPDSGFSYEYLISMRSSYNLFSDVTHLVGECVSSFIEIEMLKSDRDIKRNSKIIPYVRLTDGVNHSEWIQKGVFYIDTRQEKDTGTGAVLLTLRAYDAMLKAEQDYPWDRLTWPNTDIAVVMDICSYLGVDLDSRTSAIMTKGYSVQLPARYSCREILGYIAAMYGGNFVMSDLGKLLLVQLGTAPADTVNIGRRMRNFSSSEALSGYDRVELIVNEDDAYYAGATSGRTLTVECPWGTQAIANALLAQFRGFRYQPYKAENAIMDPAAELGDGITANGVSGEIYTMDTTFGTGFRCTVSAPWEEELDHEYPYVPKKDRKIRRQLHGLTTELSVQAGLISAKVSRTGGNAASFGWELDENSWTIEADGETVLVADVHGLEIYGRIVAKGGEIGGFTIEDGYLSTRGQYWGGEENGIYIGPNGIQLGTGFKVDRWGELTATSGTFTGSVNAGNIRYGGNYGTFDGGGISSGSIYGNRMVENTISTAYTSSGINDSLGRADYSYNVLTGVSIAEYIGCYKLAATTYVTTPRLLIGSYEVSRKSKSFTDGSGKTITINYWGY